MKSRNNFFAGLLLLSAMWTGGSAAATAAEHWDVYQPNSVPWATLRAVTVFQGNLYVGADQPDQLLHVWKSGDGSQWTEVPTSVGAVKSYVAGFETFQNSLFMFVVSSAPVPDFGTLSILQSSDGMSWTAVNGFGSFGFGVWSDSRVFKSQLYIANITGKLIKTTDGISWSVVSGFNGSGTGRIPMSLAEYQDALYVAQVINTTFENATNISGSVDGISWSQTMLLAQGENLHPGTAVLGDTLYWSGFFLEHAQKAGAGLQWGQTVVGNEPFPFFIDDQLHAAGLPSQVFAMSATGDWNVAFQENSNTCISATARSSRAVTLGGSTFIAPCNLMRFRRGIHGVSANSTQQTVSRSQTKVQFMSFQFDVNKAEQLNALSVSNVGTARANTDVINVALYKSNGGQLGQQLQELSPSADGRTWQTNAGLNAALIDGDQLIIAGDIAEQATPGATFRMSTSVNAFSFSVNSAYLLPSSLTAAQIQTIAVPESAAPTPVTPADGLTAYPSPARDTVRFVYSLTEPSDVETTLYDRRGARVLSSEDSGKSASPRAVTVMDCSSLPSGIYYAVLKISGPNARTLKTKFAIEK